MTTGDLVNPAADVPLVGTLLGALNDVAASAGLPFWLRALAGCALVAVGGFALLRLLLRTGLPWLGKVLVRPVALLVEAARAVLLLPELAVSRVFRRVDRTPPEVVYGYGAAVMAVLDIVREFAEHGLPKLAITRAAPKWLVVGILVVGFVTWNSQACVVAPDATCTSPVDYWTTSFEVWAKQD